MAPRVEVLDILPEAVLELLYMSIHHSLVHSVNFLSQGTQYVIPLCVCSLNNDLL